MFMKILTENNLILSKISRLSLRKVPKRKHYQFGSKKEWLNCSSPCRLDYVMYLSRSINEDYADLVIVCIALAVTYTFCCLYKSKSRDGPLQPFLVHTHAIFSFIPTLCSLLALKTLNFSLFTLKKRHYITFLTFVSFQEGPLRSLV